MRKLVAILILMAALAITALIWRIATRAPDSSSPAAGSAPAAATVWTPVTQQTLSHGRFKQLTVFSPHGTPRGLVLLLSDKDGWTDTMSRIATGIAEQGAMVVGVDAAQFNTSLEEDGASCVFPDGDMENLSHFVQAYYHLPSYLSPILAGYGTGGTLSYAMLAQAPVNTFAGAVSMQFCPGYPSKKRLCKGSGLEFTVHTRDEGVDFLPSRQIGSPWIVVQGPRANREPQSCDAALVQSFVAQVPGATLVDAADESGYARAFDSLLARSAAAAVLPEALKDLPLVFVDAQPGVAPSDTFAIMLSGDGGWAGLDKEVAAVLSADGIPVVGLDSLRYFWSARTPEGLAADLGRMIDNYVKQLGKQRVILVGYSQGADVLPFAVNRLGAAARSHAVLAAIIGMSEHALFEFHMSSWISDDNSGPPTLPEVSRITGMKVLCIYGEQETDSLCPRLDPHKVTIVKLKGGHHFDGDYAALARSIIASTGR